MLLAAVFVLVRGSEGWWNVDLVRPLAFSAESMRDGHVWTILTGALVHWDVWHLIMNAIGLWFFGKLVEETLGGAKYVAFVLLAAVLSHLPFLAAELATGGRASTIGASGIVLAAIVFAAFRYPGLPVYVIILPLKLWQLAALYVAYDLYSTITNRASSTDHWTHLGGAAFGFLVHRFGLPSFRLPKPKRAEPHHEPGPFRDGNVRGEIDRLLDKINAGGIGSLSVSEREFLKRNSERYD